MRVIGRVAGDFTVVGRSRRGDGGIRRRRFRRVRNAQTGSSERDRDVEFAVDGRTDEAVVVPRPRA